MSLMKHRLMGSLGTYRKRFAMLVDSFGFKVLGVLLILSGISRVSATGKASETFVMSSTLPSVNETFVMSNTSGTSPSVFLNGSTVTPNISTTVTAATHSNITSVTAAHTNITTFGLKTTANSTYSSTAKSDSTSKPGSTRFTVTNTSPRSLFSNATSISSKDTHTGSRFDAGSFIGGIVLTLSMIAVVYLSCKCIRSQRVVRYTAIEEHDAII